MLSLVLMASILKYLEPYTVRYLRYPCTITRVMITSFKLLHISFTKSLIKQKMLRALHGMILKISLHITDWIIRSATVEFFHKIFRKMSYFFIEFCWNHSTTWLFCHWDISSIFSPFMQLDDGDFRPASVVSNKVNGWWPIRNISIFDSQVKRLRSRNRQDLKYSKSLLEKMGDNHTTSVASCVACKCFT